mmetsp:Transcript_84007/g.125922  ORF Transcript_84007/g.125922 Transcript_84007/m.125922 type:complete len:360 (-) Transcript_84007:97-1176(-)|eukprot:CAMPEP_0117022994 /NCGR_PEP_ID=MMETSP0472-20121206/17211_1 /TAXON_ID=693140 ORGANISM="Tiarina fusus, Strain LIS" /NCGR_SAMPLE_ID=MMETSP0472 /ASSEMBLY_ACC=CAM_ASM_000603 /LENGTH=359 /DNA_ID=CAMNT_0004728993 /DNA_START=73 /DNA_END=1152 /DNA_ORIENTATION=+
MMAETQMNCGNATYTPEVTKHVELTINLDVIKSQATTDTRSTVSMQESSSSLSYYSSDEDEAQQQPQQPQHLSYPMDAVETESIHTYYQVLPTVIGQGQFGKVRKCIQRSTGQTFAVKSILKSSQAFEEVRQEVELLQHVGAHRGIVSLIDAFEDETYFHIITELCMGGELYDRIVSQMERRSGVKKTLFSEAHAASMLYSMLDSVAYLHDKDIVHRDLKPENFLFHDDNVQLIDFGLATTHDEEYDAPLNRVVGTPFYMAPEVLKKSYTKACDIWSMGVMAYILLVGRPPFEGQDDEEILAKVRRGVFSLEEEEINVEMSDEAKDFIKSLLKRDPRRRLTAEAAMQHPWMAKHLSLVR